MPETPKELIHDVVEEVKSLEHEADEGKTARTPLLLVSGVTLFLAVVIAILLVLAFTAYYLSN
jgi:nitrogen fixation protein FixH